LERFVVISKPQLFAALVGTVCLFGCSDNLPTMASKPQVATPELVAKMKSVKAASAQKTKDEAHEMFLKLSGKSGS
jgi:hypothetical protein